MTFSDNFIAVMDVLCDKIGIVIDWTSKNVVPYLTDFTERFIKYTIVSDMVCIISLILAFVTLVILQIKILNKLAKKHGSYSFWEGVSVLSMVCIIILLIGSVITIPIKVNEIIECTFIPEKVIIKQLSEFKEEL